ncbi:MAG TPA: GyrI-like domain-containing protein [Cyclobacteriaceae bacterium]|jgi:effector-binding domain-containing protein
MQVKEVKPINFLFFRTKTRVGELGRFVGIIARELYRDAALNDLEVTGPLYWNYFGFEGNESNPFILEIAIPVAEIPAVYHGKFQLKREESFACVSMVHEGSWFDLQQNYLTIREFLSVRGIEPCAKNREIYLNIDFMNPAANITEIQVGIKDGSYAMFNTTPAGRRTEAVVTI